MSDAKEFIFRNFFSKSSLSEKVKFIYQFLGRQNVILLGLTFVLGLLSFGVEFVFAYFLQIFLYIIGVLEHIPINIAIFQKYITLRNVIVLLFISGLIRGSVLWAELYFNSRIVEDLRFLQQMRLVRWTFNEPSASTSHFSTFYNERVNALSLMVSIVQGSVLRGTTAGLLGISLLAISPRLTFLFGVFLLLGLIPLRILNLEISAIGKRRKAATDRLNNHIFRGLKNFLMIQLYGTQDLEVQKISHDLREGRKQNLAYTYILGLMGMFPQVVGIGLICTITVFARKYDLLKPAALLSYFYLFYRFVQTASELSRNVSGFTHNLPQVKEYMEWWKKNVTDEGLIAEEVTQNENTMHPLRAGQDSLFGWNVKGLSFRYPGSEKWIVKDLTFKIHPGSCFVVTGPSGAGKSTLLNLLLGLIKPTSGQVLVSTIDQDYLISDIRKWFLPYVGYVGPESLLVEGTILENLVYGLSEKPSSKDIDAALELAECQFVHHIPNGLMHPLSEQGQGLSAGQKQRLSLARALLRNPKVLVLDEATSNLDNETELRLIETLAKLKSKLTIVAVSHRPAILSISDGQLRLSE